MHILKLDYHLKTVHWAHLVSSTGIHQKKITIYSEGSLAVSNTSINIDTEHLLIKLKSDHTFYNVTINCQYELKNCTIICDDYNTHEFILISSKCGSGDNSCKIASWCVIENDISQIDNDSIVWINRMEEVLNSFETLYALECGSNDSNYNYNYDNNSNTFIYDIGYPLYGDEFISNDKYCDAICCRGSESCSDTAVLFSNLGNIYCTGEFSCGFAQSIWTGDYTDTIGQKRDVTIFCMAYQACYASNLG